MSVASVRRLGRYALHRQIAAGGMASVHLGRLMGPAGFSRTVAIKRLHPQFAQDAHFVQMFLDEARVTGRIVHPNIVSTIDVVQERGELFIVMDFVRGAALSTLAQAAAARGTPIDVDIAVSIVLDALAGLHAAHEAIGEGRQPLHVIHRDVSPHNILVGVDGLARIADFGIAKARGRMQSTAEGQIKGKLTYMAPEVIRGEEIDARVDVYATAIVLWELLTGRKLFSGNEAAVLYDILEGTVPPPSSLRPEVPAGLDEVVLKALSKDREGRHASAAELSEAIERVVGPAPARRIGAWASELAAADLELRAALIEDLESSRDDAPPLEATSTPLPASIIAADGTPSGAAGAATVATGPEGVVEEEVSARRTLRRPMRDDDGSEGRAPATRLRPLLIAAAGLGLGVGLATLVFWPRHDAAGGGDRAPPASAASANVTTSATSATPPDVASAPPSRPSAAPTAEGSAAGSATATAPAVSSVPPSRAVTAGRPGPRPAPTPALPPPEPPVL